MIVKYHVFSFQKKKKKKKEEEEEDSKVPGKNKNF